MTGSALWASRSESTKRQLDDVIEEEEEVDDYGNTESFWAGLAIDT